jgi:hypothetical protein
VLAFFGLTPSHRLDVFNSIHEIVFHGKGGYNWTEVYNMPIWLRKFTFSKLKEFYEDTTVDRETDNTIQEGIKEALRERHAQVTTYTTKASKN